MLHDQLGSRKHSSLEPAPDHVVPKDEGHVTTKNEGLAIP